MSWAGKGQKNTFKKEQSSQCHNGWKGADLKWWFMQNPTPSSRYSFYQQFIAILKNTSLFSSLTLGFALLVEFITADEKCSNRNKKTDRSHIVLCEKNKQTAETVKWYFIVYQILAVLWSCCLKTHSDKKVYLQTETNSDCRRISLEVASSGAQRQPSVYYPVYSFKFPWHNSIPKKSRKPY